jgi:FPC/CPF motif-containing protein YcgG
MSREGNDVMRAQREYKASKKKRKAVPFGNAVTFRPILVFKKLANSTKIGD